MPLNATSPAEADAEAKAKQCDFVLYTDISALKLSAAKKIGGLLGRATGVGSGGADKTESKLDFKLFAVGDSSPRLQSSAAGKEEGDDASAGAAIDIEAKQVSAAVKKRVRTQIDVRRTHPCAWSFVSLGALSECYSNYQFQQVAEPVITIHETARSHTNKARFC